MTTKPFAEKKILIVDDEEDIREFLSFEFKIFGAQVLEAGTVDEAQMVLEEHRIDLVITDIHMPRADGMQLVNWIQSNVVPQPVVFIITGYSDTSPNEAIAKGVAGVFSKPFDTEALRTHALKMIQGGL